MRRVVHTHKLLSVIILVVDDLGISVLELECHAPIAADPDVRAMLLTLTEIV